MKAWILTALFCLAATGAFAATPFDGTWKGQAGNENLTFTFTVSPEGRVSGSVAMEGAGVNQILWGFVKSDLITFKVMRVFQGTERPFIYVGKVEGDRLALGRRPEDLTLGQLREFDATRSK